MSTNPIDDIACANVREDLSEFALHLVSGRRRAEILAHLEACATCSAQLVEAAHVADAMLLLAPEIDPPLGFESRLADRLRAYSGHNRRRRPRIAVMAVAALVAVLLGFGIGTITAGHSKAEVPVRSANLMEARLVSGDHSVGYVYLASGSPAWMFMSVATANWSGIVWCQVTSAGGETMTVGRFNLVRGHGAWGVPLSIASSRVRSASLVDASGVTLASANLSS